MSENKTTLLDSQAVGRRSGEDAAEIFQATLETKGLHMAHSHSAELSKTQKPKGTAAGDHLIEPGG